MIPGLGRSAGEGISYPVHYSWAFLVAQMVKNLPAMQDTWVQSLGWEDHREKGMATTSVFLPGEYYGQRNLVGYSPWGRKGTGHGLVTKEQQHGSPRSCVG